jgi:hypothetical protein
MLFRLIAFVAFLLVLPLNSQRAWSQQTAPKRVGQQLPPRDVIVQYAVRSGENTWRKAQKPEANLTSRELYNYALALCEAKQNLERVPRLLELGAQMQDRNPASDGYGNFRWSWKDAQVFDFNAVEFCMQGGSLLWMRHRDTLPAPSRQILAETLNYAIEGCRRHRVNSDYTNIALMNAENLILLGEALNKKEFADEGYRRLDGVVFSIHEAGVHEYASPTYYGVDLECLNIIEQFCQRPRGKAQARALLNLFWQDIAWNWFAPAQKMGGPRSREYDYLRGQGSLLDNWMWLSGWTQGEPKGGINSIFGALTNWRPDDKLWQQSLTQWPRRVRASWGMDESQSRTHWLASDVTLGSAGANYATMDIPLAVDFPGASNDPRCYFIPDGRHDPYGKITIAESSAHSKTLHLRPFWTAVQTNKDALGFVAYRDKDIPEGTSTLESHWVMPRQADAFYVGDKKVSFDGKSAQSIAVAPQEIVTMRRGTAAMAIKVLWSRDAAGQAATITLEDDANKFGVVRLTINHHIEKKTAGVVPAAALWVRVGSNLKTDAEWDNWRRAFATTPIRADVSASKVLWEASTPDGPLVIEAAAPFNTVKRLVPAPSRAVLELNGRDVGRQLLSNIEPIQSWTKRIQSIPVIPVRNGSTWDATKAVVQEAMRVEKADGETFLWVPGEVGKRGGGSGYATWKLRLQEAGKYFLWARVQSPTPDDDSFFVRLSANGQTALPATTWPLGTNTTWTWVRVPLDGATGTAPLDLPAGDITLELRPREDGAKVSRFLLTTNAELVPR